MRIFRHRHHFQKQRLLPARPTENNSEVAASVVGLHSLRLGIPKIVPGGIASGAVNAGIPGNSFVCTEFCAAPGH